MRRLSSIIAFCLLLAAQLSAQSSPHGAGFAMDCAKCHSPESWTYAQMQRFHMIAPNLHLPVNTVILNADPATPHWNLKRPKRVVMPVIPMCTNKR